MALGTVLPQGYSTVEDSTGLAVAGALVWTYASGTSTPQATYTDDSLTVANSNPIVADAAGRFVAFVSPGTDYKIVYETAATPPAHGATIKTVDGVQAIPGANASGQISGIVGQNVAAGQGVYLSDGSGPGTVAGHWYLWDNSVGYSSVGVEVAMAPNAIVSAATGTLSLIGRMTGLTALLPGKDYFIGTNGSLVLAAAVGSFTRHIGQADSVTSLILDDPAALFPATRVLNQAVNVTVTGTTAKTTIFSYTVPGNTLGTYRMLRATINGYYTNGSVGNSLLTLDGTFGGVSFLSGGVANYAGGGTPTSGPFSLMLDLTANGTAAQQNTYLIYSGPTSGFNALNGLVLATIAHAGSNGPITVNSAIDQALVFSVTNSQAAASFEAFSITIELLGQ